MSGKTIMITGASSGIGAATARAAAKAGWKVALLARSAEALSDLADEIGPEQAIAVPCNTTRSEEIARALTATGETFGALDAVFANAGLGQSPRGVETGDPENWREMIEVNIWGVLAVAHVCLPALRETRGHFLVTGSNAGRLELRGSVYGATKWFVRGFAQNLRLEMAEWGGRCTLIEPGMTDTPFFDEPKPDGLRPEDVAEAVVWTLNQPQGANVDSVRITPRGAQRPA